MKLRIKFGIKIRLPFNLFPNAATFVLHLSPEDLSELQARVEALRGVLVRGGQGDVASRLFVETGQG